MLSDVSLPERPAPVELERSRAGRPMQVWVSGFFGRDNVGDEALLAAVLANAPQWMAAAVFSPVSPARIQAIHDCPCVQEPPFDYRSGTYGLAYGAGFWLKQGLPFWRSRRRSRALIIAGGGLLNDHVAGRVVGIRKRVEAIRKLGVPVALLGIGVDPLTLAEDRKAALELMQHVCYCSVRDECSESALREVGVRPEQIFRGADLGFALPVPREPMVRPRVEDLRDAVVGLNLRPLFEFAGERGSRKQERRREYVGECQHLIARLSASVGELVLVPYNPQDVEFLQEVGGRAAGARSLRILEFTPNPYLSLTQLAELDALVGMRFHSLVFAVLRNLPLVPLVYGAKAAALAEELGIDWSSLAVGDGTETLDQPLDAASVIEALHRAWNCRGNFQRRSAALVAEKRAAAIEDLNRCAHRLAEFEHS